MKAVVITGAVTPPGRLAAAAHAAAEACRGQGIDVHEVNLATTPLPFADGRPDADYDAATRDMVAQVTEADVVLLCSPVYRATYPGALKNLLDLLPLSALRDTVVGIVVVGAAPHHYLGVDLALRSVLAWFGALAAPTSVYLLGRDFMDGRPSAEAVQELGELAVALHDLALPLGGRALGPAPLAARQ